MSKFSRDKGKRGEREVALILREHGFEAIRCQQYCGANGDADVVGIPGLHIEVKRTEKFRMYEALDQARNDAREDELPVVFTRKNNCDWVACLRLDDFMELFKETF